MSKPVIMGLNMLENHRLLDPQLSDDYTLSYKLRFSALSRTRGHKFHEKDVICGRSGYNHRMFLPTTLDEVKKLGAKG